MKKLLTITYIADIIIIALFIYITVWWEENQLI